MERLKNKMQFITTTAKTAFANFRRNKVRTFLTSLGILIGVASVVLLMAVGTGLKNYIQNQFESLGTNLLTIVPGQILQNGSFRTSGGAASLTGIEFDEKDVIRLKRINGAQMVVPIFTKSLTASTGNKSEYSSLYAGTEEIFPSRNLSAQFGTVFTRTDNSKRSKVVVLGPKLADKLFGDESHAIGRTIQLENQTYRVKGVLKPKGGGGFGGPDFDSFIYAPYKSTISFNPRKTFFTLLIKAEDGTNLDKLRTSLQNALERRYNEDEFSIIKQTEILNAITSIFAVLNSVLVLIGAISLIVGGIGIMNIMYVTVVERTREIGIRRAIGATKRQILLQFLTESVLLSLSGGVAGIIVSYLVTLAIRSVFPAEINIMSVIIAFGVSTLIGIGFGVFPARAAAELSPIEAIRYE